MEAQFPIQYHQDAETLTEMVTRVLLLHSSELDFDLCDPSASLNSGSTGKQEGY